MDLVGGVAGGIPFDDEFDDFDEGDEEDADFEEGADVEEDAGGEGEGEGEEEEDLGGTEATHIYEVLEDGTLRILGLAEAAEAG